MPNNKIEGLIETQSYKDLYNSILAQNIDLIRYLSTFPNNRFTTDTFSGKIVEGVIEPSNESLKFIHASVIDRTFGDLVIEYDIYFPKVKTSHKSMPELSMKMKYFERNADNHKHLKTEVLDPSMMLDHIVSTFNRICQSILSELDHREMNLVLSQMV